MDQTNNISTATVYVPQDDASQYEHRNSFYVDIIAKDKGGIKEVRTHVEDNAYEFEDVEDVFYIPKFTWTHLIPVNSLTVSTTTLIDNNSMWIGSDDGVLREIYFSSNSVSSINTYQFNSQVAGILMDPNDNKMFVSTKGNLYSYSISYFLEGKDFDQTISSPNVGNIICYADTSVWAVNSYLGKVVKMDLGLVVQKEYSGFDAPFKIIKSLYHNCYFVAGTHLLWKLDDSTSTVVNIYEINDYSIVDISISEDGKLCILFGGYSDGIIRVLDNDLYSLLLNEKITGSNLRFCQYCNAGRFYILSEINTGGSVYSANHYLFDSNSGVFEKITSSSDFQTTTTTTTAGTTTKAVLVKTPDGGESLIPGQEYEITWVSSKSVGDMVQIDLYNNDTFYSTLADDVANTGVYKWEIDTNIDKSNFYKVRVTWKSASSDPNNYDESATYFSISSSAAATSTTTSTTTRLSEYSIGVKYESQHDRVVMALQSGLFGWFDVSSKVFNGLFDTGVSNTRSLDVKNTYIYTIDDQSAVRVFVGSQPNYSDKWDSGPVSTSLESIYYGGGNNLEAGKKYYVNIQTYSEKYGWGSVQSREFILPR